MVDDKGKASSLIVRLIVKHGEHVIYNNVEDDNGVCHNLTIAQVVEYSLAQDHLNFSNELYNRILHEAAEKSADAQWKAEPYFLHHDDIDICRVATELSVDDYHVTQPKDEEEAMNEEARKQQETNKTDALRGQTEHLLLDFRMSYVEKHLKELQAQMMKVAGDMDKLKKLMEGNDTAAIKAGCEKLTETSYEAFGKIYQQQANQQGGAGFDPNAAQQGNASANNDDNVVDADYETVD